MTLILGMSKAEGIYMSTDYRVTDARSGRLIDDASAKLLTVQYPPEGGPKALLAYTGLAILPDGTSTGTWIRETVRGESEVFDRSMAHLRSRLDRDIAALRFPLMLNVLVVHDERRYFGGTKSVSHFCHVSFINADERNSPTSHVFLERGEQVPFDMPVVLFGIDLSGMARRFHKQATATFRGEEPPEDADTDAINEELKCRP